VKPPPLSSVHLITLQRRSPDRALQRRHQLRSRHCATLKRMKAAADCEALNTLPRQHHIVGERGTRHVGGVAASGKWHQDGSRRAHQPWLDAISAQFLADVAAARAGGAQLLDMLAIEAARQHACDDLVATRLGAEPGRDLQIDQIIDPVGARRDEAAAQRADQRLRKLRSGSRG